MGWSEASHWRFPPGIKARIITVLLCTRRICTANPQALALLPLEVWRAVFCTIELPCLGAPIPWPFIKGYARIVHAVIDNFPVAAKLEDTPGAPTVAAVTACLEVMPDLDNIYVPMADIDDPKVNLTRSDSDFYLRHGGSVALALETLIDHVEDERNGGILEWLYDQEEEALEDDQSIYRGWFCPVPELDDDYRYVRWKLHGEPEQLPHFVRGGTTSNVYDYAHLCKIQEDGKSLTDPRVRREAARYQTAYRNSMLPDHLPPFF